MSRIALVEKIDQILFMFEKALLIVFCAALTLIMVAQVIMRYFFNAPIFWAEEISLQFLIFMTIFGLSYLTKLNQHICIDVVVNLVSQSWKRVIQLLMAFLFLVLLLFVSYYSWDWIFRPDVQIEISGTTGLPKWYTYMAFPIAFSMMSWHQLVNFLKIVWQRGDK